MGLTKRWSQPLAVVKSTSDFYETVLRVCHARRSQRWLSSVSLGGTVPTYASIRGHKLRVTGSPQRGWQVTPAGVEDASSRELPFDITITDDGHAQIGRASCRERV